ncbi:MAG: nitroreductase family deazaflavin-dependent oxidoreductase [Kineosporiaceae bacterium]|nr:nitroreductase family deazaflavin-dependent oxidoreductase [Kineosporiaceae bacterium]
MPIPLGITRINRRFLNPVTLKLVGLASLVDLEHVGRVSGRVLHTPLMAFRDGDEVTVALTYGSDVQWLKNVRAAVGCGCASGGTSSCWGHRACWTPRPGWPGFRSRNGVCCAGRSNATSSSRCRCCRTAHDDFGRRRGRGSPTAP